ncbi:hypothetical protein [Streptomyces sp. A1547]|uniref:hypothetical protein n=1 Tax=Streptomyces sp. A1547 TaxID=2563105 RepID=UPI00144ACB12|nr:hypothetical protein [Streptomyces sp. A1547]
MSASNASTRLVFGLLGTLLAAGLLLAVCAAPQGRADASFRLTRPSATPAPDTP